MWGNGVYDFGNGITATGTNGGYNVVLVKYDSTGTAQWAKSVTSGSNSSYFNSVAVDSSGNIYTAGYICGNGAYGLGNGITVSGQDTGGNNLVLIKYDSSGNTQWAKSVTTGSLWSQFNSIAADSNGNIYAAGFIGGTSYGFGNGITAVGTYSGSNLVLVKYDSSGTAQSMILPKNWTV